MGEPPPPKKTLPPQLIHLDKGLKEGMTFPKSSLLNFMRQSDVCFREFSAEENCLKFGNSVIGVIKLQMSSHMELKNTFIESVQNVCKSMPIDLCEKGHSFWIEKFCNVRMKDLLDARGRLLVASSDKITGRTQNLRDTLLTDHVKPSSSK